MVTMKKTSHCASWTLMSQQAASEAELCPWCWNRNDSGEMFQSSQRRAMKITGFH